MRFFNIYQYLAPILLLPAGYYLWLRQFDNNHRFVLLILSMPMLFAYIIPALGTNWLKLWEFNTRPRLGKFRPHHGFVFGAATSLLALLTAGDPSLDFSLFELFRSGFIAGSVLAFWNWLYDIQAIKAGVIVVYNRPFANMLGPEAIATDYAPLLFGGFGLCYGLAIRLNQYILLEQGHWDYYWLLLIGCNAITLTAPVFIFMLGAYLKYGDSGLKRFTRDIRGEELPG